MKVGLSSQNRFAAFMSIFRDSPVSGLLVFGVLLIVAIIFGTSLVVNAFRERSLSNAERDITNNVSLLARHFEQQLADFDAFQKHVAALVEINGVISASDFKLWMSTPSMHRWLARGMEGTALQANLDVFDAAGNLINSSGGWPVSELNIADSSFFQALKSDTAPPILIQLDPRSSPGGAKIIVARRVAGPKGEFLGLTARALPSSTFETFFASVDSDDGDAISAYDIHGTMLARYPRMDDMIGHNFGNGPVHELIFSKSQSGSLRIRSPVDGRDRLAAANRLNNFPVSIVATRTVDAALSDWRDQTRWFVAIGCAAAAAALFVLL